MRHVERIRRMSGAAGLLLALVAGRSVPAPAQETATGDDKKVPQTIEVASLETRDATAFMVPLPSEILHLLQATEVGARIRTTVAPARHDYAKLPEWKAALALGITLADLLIGIETLPTGRVVGALDDALAGMRKLNVSAVQIEKLQELRGAVAGGAMEREKLLAEFDVMRVEMLSRGREQLGDRNFALIAVGGWSRAAHLAARAAEGEPAAIAELEVLKLRPVVETLIEWLGSSAEVQPVVANLQKILPITGESRPEPPTAQDIDVLLNATAAILNLVQ